jgi:murein L,D-transpeptidase YafK
MNSYFKIFGLTAVIGINLSLAGCAPNKRTEPLEELPPIDHILVEKGQRSLSVFSDKKLLKTYRISLGRAPQGHKEREGDHKTPEGIYTIAAKDPNSKFFRSLTISYPNKQDRQNAAKKNFSPGGGVLVHGYEPHLNWVSQDHSLIDATRGCILLTNGEMQQIFDATPVGTKIEIRA